jgi:hypothetical protein
MRADSSVAGLAAVPTDFFVRLLEKKTLKHQLLKKA